jgi:hypothetical protein
MVMVGMGARTLDLLLLLLEVRMAMSHIACRVLLSRLS